MVPSESTASRLRVATRTLVASAFGLGIATVVGWQSGISVLTSFGTGGPAMNPLTAVCVLLTGISLWVLSATSPERRSTILARGCAASVAAIGAIRLLSVFSVIDLELDHVLFRSQILASPIPSRMGFYTAIACVCVGSSLFLLDSRPSRKRWLAEALALGGTSVSLMALIGYAYAAPMLHGIMAINTSYAFLMLSVATLLSRHGHATCNLIFSDSPGGLLARRLLPTAIVIPVVLGWLRLWGQRAGLYGLEIGTALLILTIICILVALVFETGRILNVADRERRGAETALRKNLERQDFLLRANLVGVLTADPDGWIVDANPAFLEMLGYAREDLPFRFETVTPPEWHARSHAALGEIAESGLATPFEKEYLRKDGSRVPVLVGAASLPGSPHEIVAFVVDLSGKKNAQLEIERMRLFLDSVIENLPNMVFVKDAKELRFVRMNRAGEELIGVPRDQLIGKNDYDFFPKDQADFFTEKDRAVLNVEHQIDIPEEPLQTSSGEVRYLHTKKVAIVDPDGVPRYLLGISEDITARKKAEEEVASLNESLRRRAAELEAANKELEAFSYSVSHDLRAPLRHIDGFADLLSRKAGSRLDAEARRHLDTISASAKEMGQLIDDLLSFSRMSRSPMQQSMVNLGRLVEEERERLEGEAPVAKKVAWRVAMLPNIRGDARMLQLAIRNLLSNAVKYSGRNPAPEIEIESRDEGGEVVLSVRDNGVGFDMKYADKLFGVFQRLHANEDFEGTGIGLANVRRIVHRHGGRTWAEGVLGRGATFYVALPRDSVAAEREAAV